MKFILFNLCVLAGALCSCATRPTAFSSAKVHDEATPENSDQQFQTKFSGVLILLAEGTDDLPRRYGIKTKSCVVETNFEYGYLLPQAAQFLGQSVTVPGFFTTPQGLANPCRNIFVATQLTGA